jgi:hypothetical protein
LAAAGPGVGTSSAAGVVSAAAGTSGVDEAGDVIGSLSDDVIELVALTFSSPGAGWLVGAPARPPPAVATPAAAVAFST